MLRFRPDRSLADSPDETAGAGTSLVVPIGLGGVVERAAAAPAAAPADAAVAGDGAAMRG